MNRAAQRAQKRTTTHLTNVNTTTPATAGQPGAHVAPAKASAKQQAIAKKDAPTARTPGTRGKPKKPASKTAKAPKPQAGPRTGSKSAKVLALLARPKGATLADLMNATDWQAHSVRGFLSTASRKRGVAMESFQSDQGERVYRAKK